MDYQTLVHKFQQQANPVQAAQMERYMRNQFKFYGLQSKARKALYHQDLLPEKRNGQIDWDLLEAAWNDPHRELQYFVCDYLIALKRQLVFADLPRIEHFVRSKQWWDTIDYLIKPLGYLGLQDQRVETVMLNWSTDPDFWVRRTAIEHQLLRKQQTDTELLTQIIENNLDQSEFFINKAIGWALRDYSKTDPQWVQAFIQEHKAQLSQLSIKEGSKYLNK
ncbi:MAG: DNA alkylation repair protein [Lactobacillus sp.]|jgi:3-methyladenine DNA glycosylase AlkD|nr:DNA alkylation repair protein [Lactobacillus sp.]MCH4068163.1 DNA alkylation repair protein [Lactobacillus sp.]MCI1304344.1 DNA alkylation repair protein [Lactobacillus sp.]MCI1330094.1 DNA alkylation repair protein [Lactobacillus sp.]MCI1360021.1 DNA alkylation repair protein [Lactobacillus sp.]